jgi:hypothetical protein
MVSRRKRERPRRGGNEGERGGGSPRATLTVEARRESSGEEAGEALGHDGDGEEDAGGRGDRQQVVLEHDGRDT